MIISPFGKGLLPPFAALALATAAPILAQPSTASVQVQAWRDGIPMRGLTAADFELRESGRRVPITAVEEIDLNATGEALASLPPAARRHLVLLFDLPALSAAAVADGQMTARELISAALQPADLAAVVAHRGGGGIELIVPPTADRRRLLAGIEDLAARPADSATPEQPRHHGREDAAGPIVSADTALAAARSGRETDEGIVQQRQGEIHNLVRALAKLAQLPRSVSGETAVVMLSRSFDSSVILGNPATRARDRAALGEASEAAAAGEPWRVNSATRFGGGLVETALFQTLDDYRRIGCPIYAFDSGADPASPGAQGPDGLRLVADRTGGSFANSSAELTRAVAAALEPSGVSYLLSFEPRKPGRQGYRRLEVTLTETTGGPSLRHRPGHYWPPTGS